MKTKILSIFGTRPEAIKMLPIILEAKKYETIESKICVTAQHRELLDSVLLPFDVKPDYDLDLMRPGQSLAALTARAVTGLEAVIKEAAPDWVLVHGDTSTTFAAGLAAFYASGSGGRTMLGHVEAGLRTYNKFSPYPEEINRRLTAVLADMHFAPTETARQNLLQEGIKPKNILVTGNTAIDMLKYTVRADYQSPLIQKYAGDIAIPVLHGVDGAETTNASTAFSATGNANVKRNCGKRLVLLTAHRRENWGAHLENIFRAVRKIADDFDDVQFVYPVHPNPAVKIPAEQHLGGHPRIALTEPLELFDMHNLIRRAFLVVTDSGGLQEEAPALDKPVIVLREVTERPEGEKSGCLVLAGRTQNGVYSAIDKLLTDADSYAKMATAENPFGDGSAAARILDAIL